MPNIKGLGAYDGAPVLDIKPYTADRIVADARMASWHEICCAGPEPSAFDLGYLLTSRLFAGFGGSVR